MSWRPTAALRRAVLLAGGLALAGVVLARPELVLLAAPFAIGTAWALRRVPQAPLELAVQLADQVVLEGAETGATLSAANPGAGRYDLVVVRSQLPRWLEFAGGDRPHAISVPPQQVAELALPGPAQRWGRHRVGPVTATGYAGDALLVAEASRAEPQPLAVYPATVPFRAGESMPRAVGVVGSHRSRQPGQGGELAGVRQFMPGDRLRRVDWRVSLRTGQPHVAATLSDRDAEVVLVLDVLTEAGVSGGIGGPASVLDTTVRAAAAIAEHYLHRGDRVSLVEYGRRARRLRPATGRRQYLTVLEWLLDLQPGGGLTEPYERVFGPHLLAADALMVALTPLVEPGAAAMLARLVRAGRPLVAVDTMPAGLPGPEVGQHSQLAYRLWRLERDNTIGALREHGVPLVPWAGAGSLDQVLRRVSRAPVRLAGSGVAARPVTR